LFILIVKLPLERDRQIIVKFMVKITYSLKLIE